MRRSPGTLLSLILPFLLVGLVGCAETEEQAPEPHPAPTAAPGPAPADTVRYEGIDVSHFQGTVDWAAVRAAGRVFAFTKATEGTSEVDPMFATNWAGIDSAGLVRGAYHFFDPDADAQAQAEHFIATVQLAPGDLPPVLDIEVTDGVSEEGIEADIHVWLERVAAAYGVTPILYSDLDFLAEELGSGFGTYPLWIAEYTDTPPTPPSGWSAWTFWQFSQSGSVAGVTGAVDEDVFVGTEAQWNALRVGAE